MSYFSYLLSNIYNNINNKFSYNHYKTLEFNIESSNVLKFARSL